MEPSVVTMIGLGLLAVRLAFGLTMAAHGAQKLFGWFGGHGLQATSAGFEMIGFRPGRFYASAAGWMEFLSGALTALGFLGPLGPALMFALMIVAGAAVHWKNGFFAPSGIELNLLFGALGFAVALTGAGAFSVDRWVGLEWLSRPTLAALTLTVSAIGALAVMAARRTVAPAPQVSQPSR